jgi:membrane protein insertase Oxa1/YidC/SpoIIIJ
LIQLPIFIALYQVIQMFTLHRDKIDQYTYGFVKLLEPVKDLIAHPNHFNENSLGFISLTQRALSTSPFTINIVLMILAIGAAYTQYVMAKQITPKTKNKKRLRDIMNEAADGKETDKTEMNSIMMGSMTKFLPVMMFLIIINLPGAIALYYTVQNVVAVIQQGRVLKEDTSEMIELADDTPVIAHKKATAKARAKEATQATIIRIKAKDTTGWQGKKKG